MAKVTIGGTEYNIPEMSFSAVELAWPFIERATETIHPVHGTKAAIGVIAAGLLECEEFNPRLYGIDPLLHLPSGEKDEDGNPILIDHPKEQLVLHDELMTYLLRNLKAKETGNIKLCLFEILEEAGFEMAIPGELPAAVQEAIPSPVTAAPISVSSSQPASKEDVGIGSTESGASDAIS